MLKKIIKIYKSTVYVLQNLNSKKVNDKVNRLSFEKILSISMLGKVKNNMSPSGLLSQTPRKSLPDFETEGTSLLGCACMGDKTPGAVSGFDRLNNPALNKSLAFSINERQLLGIHGLLPPVVKTQNEQIKHCKLRLDRLNDPLDKYIYLMDLLDFNEKLLYAFVKNHIQETMPLLYTPTVGSACQKWGFIYRRPRGVYITMYDKGHVYEVLKNWPECDVRVIVVTDGERILGLGDQGACGMGIPVGKLALYTAIAGIKPHFCLPITIDVGTNNECHIKDPLYPGIKEKRRTGKEYDELIDEFMKGVVQRWGSHCLVQFEDFGNKNAFRFLEKYRNYFCMFNDDIQGTASVVLAGLIAAMRITKNKLIDHVILFQGAGEANIGIANLCVLAMMTDENITEEKAREKIWMVDSKGLIVKSRNELEIQKRPFAKDHEALKDLLDVVKKVKPTILVGAAAVPGSFTPEILQEMARNNERPIVFALSNPTCKAECTPQQAYEETKGKVIYASGSPFPPVTYNNQTFITGQGNNAYIFPAIGLATMCAGIPNLSDDYFFIAAEALANQVKESYLEEGCIYPPIDMLPECSIKVASTVVEYAYKRGSATVLPEPSDKEKFVRAQLYRTEYEPAIPSFYEVPLGDQKNI
ncbi:unnamed protein product [Phyllotreta striolata]|uniref:Malic enzyme n=1 Tax=Phyllotreta striolata TaxID=444603 RepID=A0A9N9THC4_PHYSR|nr:unnamed protein product [Phyllotreta striolata]